METAQINIPEDELRAFCERWNVTEFAVVNTDTGPDFNPDIQFLVRFSPKAEVSFFELFEMEDELGAALGGKEAMLVTRKGVEHSASTRTRGDILSTVRPILDLGDDA